MIRLRSILRAAVAMFVAFVACGCGSDRPTAPSAPTAVEFSLSGGVQDTAFRPIAGARVEVIDTPRAGVFAVTDTLGRFQLPGVFSGTVTLRASKDEYLTVTRPYETRYPGPQQIGFSMEPATPSVDISGNYLLTFTADSSCSELPAATRTRSYDAAVSLIPQSNAPNLYRAVLSGATFYPSSLSDRFVIGVAGTFARIESDFDGIGITEQLESSTYLSVVGTADATATGSSVSGAFNGWFEYCASPSVVNSNIYRCPVPPTVCQSSGHRLTLLRR